MNNDLLLFSASPHTFYILNDSRTRQKLDCGLISNLFDNIIDSYTIQKSTFEMLHL